MANPALLNALMGRPVRSVDDYLAQYETRDAQKAAVQQNALAAMENAQIRKLQMEEIRGRQQAALLKAKQEQQQQNMRGGYLNSIDPSAGPAMEFNPVSALRAGLDEKEIGLLSPQARKTITVGNTVLDAGTMKPLYQAPEKPKAPPEILQIIETRDSLPQGDPRRAVLDALITKQTTHAPAASAVSYGSPVPIMLPDGTIGYAQPGNKAGAQPQVMTGPGGKPLVKPGDAEKPLTEGQAKAVAFASRMQSADQTLAELARAGTRASIPGSMQNNSVGDVLTALAPADQQRLNQAKRDFVNATLRRESGAVISPEEFSNADRQYFPQIGDSRAVIEQKAKNRRTAIEGIKADVPTGKRGEVDRISGTGGAPADGAFKDPEKERRYQEWKRQQGQ